MRAAATARRRALSIGLLGNAADVLPELVRRGVVPDLVTDQTSRPRPAERLRARPASTLDEAARAPARPTPTGTWPRRAGSRWPSTCRRCSTSQAAAPVVFDYGNNLRGQAVKAGVAERLRLPRLRARVHPAALLRGQGPVPLGALSGDPEDIAATDEAVLATFPEDRAALPAGSSSPASG